MTINYEVVTDVTDLPDFDPSMPTFFDIESGDLYIEPRLVQLYQPQTSDKVYIYDIAPNISSIPDADSRTRQIIDFIKPLWLVAYNASYDLGTLNFVPEKIDDLFYAVKTAYPHFMQFSLDKVTESLPYARSAYARLDKKAMHKMGFKQGAYLSSTMLEYSATDVVVLEKMWNDPKIQNVIQHNLAYKIDILNLRYAVQYQQNGLIVAQGEVEREIAEAEAEVAEMEAQLPQGLNVNSSKQVKEYLGTEGASKEVLLRSDHPDAIRILKLKKRKKELSYLRSINHPKMYTRFNPAGAVTGRFTSTGGALCCAFNAQQIPHRFQYLFTQPTEDTVAIGYDYGTLELRVAASLWGISNMRKFFIEGKDLHSIMAQKVTGKKLHPDGVIQIRNDQWGKEVSKEYITNEDRTHAKAINFGFIFGMSAKAFVTYAFNSYGVEITLEEAMKFREAFFELYPEALVWHEYVWKNYKKPTFFVETALGRRVKPQLGTDGINIPVQGTGAEVTKLAVHYLIKEHPQAINYIYNVVHDCIYVRVPKQEEEYWREELKKAMLKGWSEMQKTKAFKFRDIPMIVD